MTLAVAACWPWGNFAEMVDSGRYPVRPYDVLIVATDSRFTLLNGRHDDTGRKLYPLPPSAALLYAGDVMAAEDTCNSVIKTCQERRGLNYSDLCRLIRLRLQSAYTSEKRRRCEQDLPAPGPLHMLFATVDGNGLYRTVKFSSSSNRFRPEIARSIEVLGHPNDVERFRQVFWSEYARREAIGFTLSGTDDLYTFLLSHVLGSMEAVIESPNQSGGVGGRLQALIITKGEMKGYGLHRTRRNLAFNRLPLDSLMSSNIVHA